MGELYKDRLQQFKEVDPDLKKKFDRQHKKYQKIESAYSIQNILWLIAAIGVFYYTNFYLAIRYDPRINRYDNYRISLAIRRGCFPPK